MMRRYTGGLRWIYPGMPTPPVPKHNPGEDQCSFGCGKYRFLGKNAEGDERWECPKGHKVLVAKGHGKK